MAWARLDDNAAFHPKVLKAGNEGFGAVMRMVAWCAQYGTDGRITEAMALAIAGSKQLLDHLLDVCLLDCAANGATDSYVVHDFLDYNPSAKAVATKRAARAAAGRRGGIRRVANRAKAAGKQLLEQLPKQTPSKTEANGQAKFNPVPVPDPDPIPDLKKHPRAAKATPGADLKEQAGKVWEHYRSRWAESRLPVDGLGPLMTSADFMVARKLVKDFGEDEAKTLIDRYLDDADGWLAKQGHPLKAISSRVNAYRQRQAARRAGPPPIAAIPDADGGFSKL